VPPVSLSTDDVKIEYGRFLPWFIIDHYGRKSVLLDSIHQNVPASLIFKHLGMEKNIRENGLSHITHKNLQKFC
jgi:hypothetical protein